MHVYGPALIHGTQPVSAPHHLRIAPATLPSAFHPVDQVHISQEAELVSRIGDLPDIRGERIESIRAAIAGGVYETHDKLEIAVERLLDEIA
jgi:negative regulator of flagellin synthesis FlgM